MNEAAQTPGAEEFTRKHLRRNVLIYLVLLGWTAQVGAFSDMFALLPNLALKLNAPKWVAVIPTVAATSITHIPPFIVAWLMLPHVPRRKVYAALCVPMCGAMLFLGIVILTVSDRSLLLSALVGSVVVYAIINGLTIIPCWDLFARMFPEDVRGKVTGNAQAVYQAVSLVVGPAAAWLISSRSPLPYPKNYGVSLLISVAGMAVITYLILMFKEYQYPQTESGRSFGKYCRCLIDILRSDDGFRRTLWGALLASALVPVSGLMLVYAKEYRGFTDNHVALLVGIRPYIGIGLSLLLGLLAARFGSRLVCTFLSLMLLVSAASSPFLSGIWQIGPQLLSGFSFLIYGYLMVTVMDHAPAERTQDYLSIFYLVSVIPGFTPVALAKLMDYSSLLAVGIVVLMTIACALVYGLGGSKPKEAVIS